MTSSFVLLLAFLIGFFNGLRSLTPPALVAWGARLGWLKLARPLALVGTVPAVAILSLGALVELVLDKLPRTPSRTAPAGLSARIVFGAFTGACVASGGGQGAGIGAALGVAGALLGCFGGRQARMQLVKALRVPDFAIALVEDALTIGGTLWVVSRF
jgi:uncharacterized membrane protein